MTIQWLTAIKTGVAHAWVGEEYPLCDTPDGGYCDPKLVRAVDTGDVYCRECRDVLRAALARVGCDGT